MKKSPSGHVPGTAARVALWGAAATVVATPCLQTYADVKADLADQSSIPVLPIATTASSTATDTAVYPNLITGEEYDGVIKGIRDAIQASRSLTKTSTD